ncbi:DUF4294 domain-containing protein [Empedobacter falsenii]|uniref:DUF4294 domain-containing protein n=1 Tax=Empedobacter falsenii TaxID=343874 RepID=A0ABY8VCF9_9FLAO|nr:MULTISPECIES: DUF4294 domain-containing protein [Empedobacter]MCA4776422.1 DUF4294 domain-containing protein [Empedobacter stercoris]MCA4782793.1 DUF4294 domain-containing protein [Empedobacter stercoris]MCA4809242.1 DUF4294 domain-containing protein [Empedobacter stercoris]QNT13780.1 DUF4294 domain-containing protein [Empedobacter stercoris]WIH97958.1 DUF4294 domain-containing protein [Empedobacter falsenii]
MKFYIYHITLMLTFLGIPHLNAQIFGLDLGGKSPSQEIKNDSINIDELTFSPFDTIHLNESSFYSVHLKSDLEKKYYIWLRKRVRDVWPYVRTAVREYNYVSDTIQTMDKRRDKKRFIKTRQKDLADQFENQLKNMSSSRGQILTKLIYKETDKTTYDIIKELRGGLNAFLYQAASGAFNIDLKQTFDPKRTREDLYIAVILQRDFADGILKPVDED